MFIKNSTKKTLFFSLIFLCGWQYTMERSIQYCGSFPNGIKEILPCKLFGREILVVQEKNALFNSPIKEILKKQGEKEGSSLFIIDAKRGSILQNISAQTILNQSLYNKLEPDKQYKKLSISIINETRYPHINIAINQRKIDGCIAQYNPVTKKFNKAKLTQKKTKKQAQRKYYEVIGFNSSKNRRIIQHDAYIIRLLHNQKKDSRALKIQHYSNPLYIELKNEAQYQVFANPHKNSPYLLLSHLRFNKKYAQPGSAKITKPYFHTNIVLYDTQTGAKKIDANIPGQELCNVIFGRNDDFMLLISKQEITLYDLHAMKQETKYLFYNRIEQVILSTDNTYFIVATSDKALHSCENPLRPTPRKNAKARMQDLLQEDKTNINAFEIKIKNKTITSFISLLKVIKNNRKKEQNYAN